MSRRRVAPIVFGVLALAGLGWFPVARACAQAPEPPVPELLASADQAWKAGRYDAAFDRYQLVLRRDSTSALATFRVATVLARRNDLDHSAALFRRYLRLAPTDDDGRLGLARTLAWARHYDQALALTDSVLAATPDHRDATLLAAQILAWRGNFTRAIARYQRWLDARPNDAVAWSELARTWQWAGRIENARDALHRAVEADPANAEIRAQLATVDGAASPSMEPTISSTDASDENRTTVYSLRGSFGAPWNARLVGDASYRTADLATLHGTSASLRASSSWTPMDGHWTLRGEIGGAQLAADEGIGTPSVNRVEPLASMRLAGRVTPWLSLGASASRIPFDETAALIYNGIMMTSTGVDGAFVITPRLRISGDGDWTRLTGGSGPNIRVAGGGSVRWSPDNLFSLATSLRGFAYQRAATDGYFAPKRYLLAELSPRLRLGGELGWALESEVGLGDQSFTSFDGSRASRFAQRVAASLLYRPALGVEWGVSGGFTNVASPTTTSIGKYHSYTVALQGRVRL